MNSLFRHIIICVGLLSLVEAAPSQEPKKAPLRNIDLEKIFKVTHGTDRRLGFDITPEEQKTLFQGDDSTYGEMTPKGIHQFVSYIMSKFQLNPVTTRLLDVGSGVGRIPMGACALANFAKCDGVELAPTRFKISKKALQVFHTKYRHLLKPNQVTLINMNALNYDMRSYNLIWLASLCLSAEQNEQFRQKFEAELPEGAIIACLLQFKLPPNSRLELVEVKKIVQSWDAHSDSFIYRVKGPKNQEAGTGNQA